MMSGVHLRRHGWTKAVAPVTHQHHGIGVRARRGSSLPTTTTAALATSTIKIESCSKKWALLRTILANYLFYFSILRYPFLKEEEDRRAVTVMYVEERCCVAIFL
jgi:hypothetical protein